MVEEGAARISVNCTSFQPQTHIFLVRPCTADVVVEILVAFDIPCKSELQLGFGFPSITLVFLCGVCMFILFLLLLLYCLFVLELLHMFHVSQTGLLMLLAFLSGYIY